VTGYIPIQGHPRTAAEYGELGELFAKISGDFYVQPFYETIGETWLAKTIQNSGVDVSHSVADNPKKNTLAYHCVQHQKFGWLVKAAVANPLAEIFVWMDYGIAHVPGVTVDVVNAFMADVRPDDFAIPGCWPRDGLMISDHWPCWRFCGGLIVIPKRLVWPVYKGIKKQVETHIKATGNVEWEVNTLARAEPSLPPIRWYQADHDETMFENYKKGLPNVQGQSGVGVCAPEGETPEPAAVPRPGETPE
jgi:hypothetical protein